MPLRVSFLVPYPWGRAAGQRYRFEQWLRMLPEGAVQAHVSPLFSPDAYGRLYVHGAPLTKVIDAVRAAANRAVDAANSRRADVVFLYREAFPLGPPVIEALLERRVPLVFDFDDAIWLRSASPANAFIAPLKNPAKVARIVSGATATTVGNGFLAAWAEQHGEHVHVIPTTIDVEAVRPRPRERGEVVRLGWTGSTTTFEHLRSIEPALRQMLRDLPVELVVIGDASYRLDGSPRVRAIDWDAATELDEVAAFDIGLMPLPDDEWSRGKCGFKALLYMAHAVPAIVSPVGANTEIVRDGENGLWARTTDEWVAAVERLVTDEALRLRLGAAGRQTVVESYSGQRWAPRFLEVLEQAAS